jgi:type IV pilus assembly protein PilN
MIRINLLPEAKRQASTGGSGQLWAVVYMLAGAGWSVVLMLFYLSADSKLDEKEAANKAVQAQIDQVKAQSANIGEVEAKLAKSRELQKVVQELQDARQGPARVLMELSHILSAGRGPAVNEQKLEAMRRENPLAGFNPGWDIRRLWLTTFTESNRMCKLSGFGKSNEDVAEFLRRLSLSEVFREVTLQSTSAAKDNASGLPTVKFDMTCKVVY